METKGNLKVDFKIKLILQTP